VLEHGISSSELILTVLLVLNGAMLILTRRVRKKVKYRKSHKNKKHLAIIQYTIIIIISNIHFVKIIIIAA
jgi:hypothetical protein